MKTTTMLKGMIMGTEAMGAKFVKMDENHVYFKIVIGGELDDESTLSRCKEGFDRMLGLGLKVRKVATLDDGEVKGDYHKPSKQDEPLFSTNQIQQLQSKVHKITGDGEVMGLFNELLGICAG